MAHLGTLRDFRFENQSNDIRGAALYGRDEEKLGKIKDVIFDHATGTVNYVVVDTGGWLSSKLFLVPADRIRLRGKNDDEYVCDLSKKQIENFPVYDEENLNDPKRWKEYEREYRGSAKFEETGDVLHQAGGTNILVSDGLRADGPAPTTRSGKPVSGYKSPIQHREVGMMDTTPTGVGQNTENERLTFVPDAVGGDRADIRDKDVPATTDKKTSYMAERSVGEAAEIARNTRERDIVHREDDRLYHTDRGSKLAPVEQTIEGDAIFNSEDIAGRMHQRGNVHDADEPSYQTVGGTETQTSQGRLPNYPDAGQGQRWARFEENLRRQRPKIVGRCSVCEEFQNRKREDVA
jgi:sporulation protein YlmC with PRC-barrel domain